MSVCTDAGAFAPCDSVLINFRQSKTYLDTAYMDNAEALRKARIEMSRLADADSLIAISGVTVVGAASPEGSVKFNRWLSQQRAERIFDYFRNSLNLSDSLTSFEFVGRDWEGLRELVEADPAVPYREDVISELDAIISGIGDTETESQGNLSRIKRLHNGEPYLYMYRHLFPQLRASRLMVCYQNILPLPRLDLDTLCRLENQPPYIGPIAPLKIQKPFYMDLRTNLLYDALAVPNIGAEFYLGKNLSIVGNWMYGWWDTDRRHRYWRIYGGDITLRWWFGERAHEKPLTGHHIGIYGGVVTYDFEFGGRGYMGGLPGRTLWDRCNREFGVEYGYSLPIARRFNLDFTLGVGYLGGEYREYIPCGDCYLWQATKRLNWVGPTKLEVSLVWLIGRGNVNERKGGSL